MQESCNQTDESSCQWGILIFPAKGFTGIGTSSQEVVSLWGATQGLTWGQVQSRCTNFIPNRRAQRPVTIGYCPIYLV
eukprot:7666642-Ditylum_brightwellii.AAC.1